MAETGTTTPRERYRTQVRTEIKERAWEQIATAGATALSLNAIAKQMGMSGPALYRYFAGRDELITELIRDAYGSLADALRTAAESGADLTALAHALREWALADPHRYFLIYGTPVPGYQAPDDVTGIAQGIMATLLDACAVLPSDGPATPFDTHLESHRQWAAATPPRPRPSTGAWPSGPGCTAFCPSNSPVTSTGWASTQRCCTRPNWTTC